MKSRIVILTLSAGLIFLVQTAAGTEGRDLVIDPNALDPFIDEVTFGPSDCAVDHGCTLPGIRRLLKFTSVTQNIGDTDVALGSPTDPNGPFELDSCHGHSHYGVSAQAELLDGAVQLAVSEKRGFCLLDGEQFDPNANSSAVYGCASQGLQSGWADVYSSSLDCQWVDITGIPGGTYTLRLTGNPEQSTALEDPNNFGNNVVEIQVVIPGEPAEPVPTLPRWALLLNANSILLGAGRYLTT
jgi:hypothetical protein